MVLGPVEVKRGLIDAGQELIYDPFSAVEGFPHGNVALSVASDDKGIAHLAKAVDLVVFVDVGNVRIVERVLYLGEEIHDVGVCALGFLLGGVLVYHRSIAAFFVVDGV